MIESATESRFKVPDSAIRHNFFLRVFTVEYSTHMIQRSYDGPGKKSGADSFFFFLTPDPIVIGKKTITGAGKIVAVRGSRIEARENDVMADIP